MADLFERATAYYQSAASDPWRWADNAEVLVWADGSTIAFRGELAQVLDGLASGGLPPFRVVVLILAACKGKLPPAWECGPVLRESVRPAQLELPPPLPGETAPESARDWIDPANQEFSELIARLRLLHQLPPEQRESPRAKTVLIETILEGVGMLRVEPAREIAGALTGMPALRDLNSPEIRLVQDSVQACRWLYAGLKNFSASSFALRLRTGLDALPAAAGVELKPSERARQLLALLREDPQQQGLAKAARDIMAAIYLPRALSQTDELALGGFSDIANRGSLDRLLASELANDDLTLASRIALNEALYIRREPPASHPPARLAMLLDIGLRQWGVPRVFATAVALAFIAKEERCTEAAVWRARRSTIEQTDLLTQNGLVDHLAALDTYAHPGTALKPFFAQFEQQPDMEAVLVTHRDCLADPDLQRQLAAIDWERFYIATVDRDGTFELFAHPNRQKPLCQAEIALEGLFREKPVEDACPPPPLIDPRKGRDLPLILDIKPFPFLLPALGKIVSSCQLTNGGGLAVVFDRRLVRWDRPGKGTYTLIERLPPGKTFWLGTTDHERRVHVFKALPDEGKASLTSWDQTTGCATTSDLKFGWGLPEEVFERNGILFVRAGRVVAAWQLEDARQLGQIELPVESACSRTKYIRHPNGEWSFLSYNATGLCLEPLPLPACFKGLKIRTLFDRVGLEAGPWALTAEGQVLSSEGKCILNMGKWVALTRISQDGYRVFLTYLGENYAHLIDLETGAVRQVPMDEQQASFVGADSFLEPRILPAMRSMRVNFTEISAAPGKPLLLRAAKGPWHQVSLVCKSLRLTRLPNGSPKPASPVKFAAVPLPQEYNFRLKVASWPDGSKAWLDSRGLLHLRSSNPSSPEVSLVLCDGPLAAWSSDGNICGPDFFLRNPASADTATLMKRIELFCPTP